MMTNLTLDGELSGCRQNADEKVRRREWRIGRLIIWKIEERERLGDRQKQRKSLRVRARKRQNKNSR